MCARCRMSFQGADVPSGHYDPESASTTSAGEPRRPGSLSHVLRLRAQRQIEEKTCANGAQISRFEPAVHLTALPLKPDLRIAGQQVSIGGAAAMYYLRQR